MPHVARPPAQELIDITNVDSTLRAVYMAGMAAYVPELGGMPWFPLRGPSGRMTQVLACGLCSQPLFLKRHMGEPQLTLDHRCGGGTLSAGFGKPREEFGLELLELTPTIHLSSQAK